LASNRPYLLVNLILAGIIGIILIYSGLFSAEKANHPIPSFYERVAGEPAPSAGMSRAFSSIMRGRLDEACRYNLDSLPVFAFFLIQLIQRISISFLLERSPIRKKHLLPADVFLSSLLFLYCFQGQIRAMFILFRQMLHLT
jgi:hypothetical protein